MIDLDDIRTRYQQACKFLDERGRRLFAANEALALGHGGVTATSAATGLARSTIRRAIVELQSGANPIGPRVRRKGGGRKSAVTLQPELLGALETLIEDAIRGDPETPLRWVSRSQRQIARVLGERGFAVSQKLVGLLLRGLGYSCQANCKTREGTNHPDRDAQFAHINTVVQAAMAAGQPAISVDTKKKELVGDFKNPGRELRPKGQPEPVRVHDFELPDLGKVAPYGVYDLAANAGWVNVGVDADTAAFAVESIRRWWQQLGQTRYPEAKRLVITADCGGSNGARVRLWKRELQRVANECGLVVTVAHLPPGTSKWNRIEHRLFAAISRNWRGKPLVSHQVIVQLIGATTTQTGLTVRCELDANRYPKGIKVTDAEMATLAIMRTHFTASGTTPSHPTCSHLEAIIRVRSLDRRRRARTFSVSTRYPLPVTWSSTRPKFQKEYKMTQADRSDAFSELMALRAMPAPETGEVTITGSDPFYRTPFRIGDTAAAVLAATGVAANDLWELRTGRRQAVGIAVPEAAATLRVVDYTMKRNPDGQYRRLPVSDSMKHMATVTQPWPTADGRWFLPHFNLPHLERRVLDVLECESTPASVSAAVSRWNADALEAATAQAHACGGKIRTREEWLAHPQGAYLAARPVVEITKVAEGEPEPLPPGDRPLSGVRVLDLTRILAGPTAGRMLAEHGADVLMVAAPHLPQVPEYVRDLSHGKRSCFLDLRRAAEADVFVNGYRPGQLGRRGFGLEDLVGLRPGLIVISISCFGSGGPFASRAGWEQIAQSVSGIAHTHGQMTGAGRPKLAPAPICDYLTGYLAAYGAMLALARRAREGGSYHVQTSLCQSAMFYQRQGLISSFNDAPEQLTEVELEPLYVREDSSYGDLLTLGPVLRMSETPCRWALPTPKFGGDRPEWLTRNAEHR